MIILPDKNIPRAKFLMPVLQSEWRDPSHALEKDEFNNPVVKTMFYIKAMSNDGVCIWKGWFDSREDADAFLWSIAMGTLKQERALWDLPTPSWQPWMGELITYEFATQTYLTGTSDPSSYSRPSDWNNNSNTLEAVGPGAKGGMTPNAGSSASGGGGGAYSKAVNQSIDSTNSYTAGAAVTSTSVATNAYFKNSGATTTYVSAQGGLAGSGQSGSGAPQGTGGQASSGTGSVKYNGGTGTVGGLYTATGGGGAASMNGAGGDSTYPHTVGDGTAGSGNGGVSGSGLAGGAGAAGDTGCCNNPGQNGTEWSASYGSGSGGSGYKYGGGSSGAGGNYGGGGGGANGGGGGTPTAAVGKQGLIVITYTPFSAWPLNMPMLGM